MNDVFRGDYQEAVSVARSNAVADGGGVWFQWDVTETQVLYGEEVSADGTIRVLTEAELAARQAEGSRGDATRREGYVSGTTQ